MPSSAFFLKATGALLMLHAAYSCMHYRSILMDLDLLDVTTSTSVGEDGSSSADSAPSMMIPPLDVYVEVGLAFVLLLLGELLAMGPLQTVEVMQGGSAATTRKPLVAAPHKTRDFDVYSNRSKLLLRRATVAAR